MNIEILDRIKQSLLVVFAVIGVILSPYYLALFLIKTFNGDDPILNWYVDLWFVGFLFIVGVIAVTYAIYKLILLFFGWLVWIKTGNFEEKYKI